MRRAIEGIGKAAVFCIAILALGAAATQAIAAQADDGGQQARAVRLSDVEGQVSVSQNGQPLADHALANMPLFEGTQITTGDDGRAEVQFENGTIARIPPDSTLTLAVLRQGDTEIDLNSGEGYFELESANQDHPVRVRFGSNVVTASGFTVIRVQLDQPPGNLAVFSGNAHLEAANNTAMDLHGGESVDLGQYNLAESIEPDSWDAWNSDRDQAITSAEASTTAATNSMPNNNNPAWSDLNQNGAWYNTPDQGYVWSPYDASNPGWDPYGNGSWMMSPRMATCGSRAIRGVTCRSSAARGIITRHLAGDGLRAGVHLGGGAAEAGSLITAITPAGTVRRSGRASDPNRPPRTSSSLAGRGVRFRAHYRGQSPRGSSGQARSASTRRLHSAAMIGGSVVEPLGLDAAQQSLSARAGFRFGRPTAAERASRRVRASPRVRFTTVRRKRAGILMLRRATRLIFPITSRARTRATARLAQLPAYHPPSGGGYFAPVRRRVASFG